MTHYRLVLTLGKMNEAEAREQAKKAGDISRMVELEEYDDPEGGVFLETPEYRSVELFF